MVHQWVEPRPGTRETADMGRLPHSEAWLEFFRGLQAEPQTAATR
jgi:hypothetical protein